MKYAVPVRVGDMPKSPPSRGAWIEIRTNTIPSMSGLVAPLAGGVD